MRTCKKVEDLSQRSRELFFWKVNKFLQEVTQSSEGVQLGLYVENIKRTLGINGVFNDDI